MTSRNRDAATAFDAAFAERAPDQMLRPASDTDTAFCRALFVACSPLASVLPAAMLDQQADFQARAHRDAYPAAMERIVTADGAPIGRVMIDWQDAHTHLVDIAVLPAARQTRAGRAMLHAWLAVADATARDCSLDVAQGNPALAIYRALGFGLGPGQNGQEPTLRMVRPRPA